MLLGSITAQSTSIIENLDKIIDAFGLTVETIIAILNANAPSALNEALGANLVWAVTIQPIDIQNNPAQPVPPQGIPTATAADPAAANTIIARLQQELRDWKRLNALWIVPIAVTLFVLWTAYREMNRITELHEANIEKVLSDEIARAAARSDRFDEQHTTMLQRQETALKESADAIRAVLVDEIKHAASRSDYFDQQQVLLLQRYENLSKDSSEAIKALVQKTDACCKPADCDKLKDRCQKAKDSKN